MIISCLPVQASGSHEEIMSLISIRRQDILQENKARLLEELASLDVELALPPTDRIPQDRRPSC